MKLFIKVCGLQSADDVRAAVDAGADAVGFVFAESPREVSPEAARDASSELPGDIYRVAVMRHPGLDYWYKVLEVFAPDALQTDIDDFEELDVPSQVRRWPVIREGHATLEDELPEVFVYEGAESGRGRPVDWNRAAAVATRGHMILAGGLSAENVAAAIATVRPWGIDVSSGVESAPGRKEPGKIREFISAARAAEQNQ